MFRAVSAAVLTFFLGSFVSAGFVLAFAKFCGVELGEPGRVFTMMMVLVVMPFASIGVGIAVFDDAKRRNSFPG